MTDMPRLEINVYRGDSIGYRVELRFTDPQNSDAEDRISGVAHFDLDHLRNLGLDAPAYGHELTNSLFADPDVRYRFASACGRAGGHPIRLRLAIDECVPELHALRWETLRDPSSNTLLLTTSQHVLFSRYLSGTDWRPVRLRPKSALRALVVIASPSDISDSTPPPFYLPLAPLDVPDELQRARDSLGTMHITSLESKGTATLNGLVNHLRDGDGYDILYLVAHGAFSSTTASKTPTPLIWLEKSDGTADVVDGNELAARLQGLSHRPSLVVLASCQSAGTGGSESDSPLIALGPLLAQAGIPAVLAMQGNITMQTSATFLASFFRTLQRDGCVDHAMAVARSDVRDRVDWWMPVLFTRLTSGCLWHSAGADAQARELRTWIHTKRLGIQNKIEMDDLIERLLACPATTRLEWAAYHDLEELIEHIRFEEVTSLPMHELDQLLQRILPQPIPRPVVAELQQLCQQISLPSETLHALYTLARPAHDQAWNIPAAYTHHPQHMLAYIVRRLAQSGIDNVRHTHPIFSFVQSLIKQLYDPTTRPVKEQLTAWIERVANQVKSDLGRSNDHDQSDTTDTSGARSPAMRAYLLIVIAPTMKTSLRDRSTLDQARFYVQACLSTETQRGDSDVIPLRQGTQYSLEEIASTLIDELLRESRTKVPAEPIIEFFLPYELLLHHVDNWEMSMSSMSRLSRKRLKIGQRHPVVVRSLDRWKQPEQADDDDTAYLQHCLQKKRAQCEHVHNTDSNTDCNSADPIVWIHSPDQCVYDELMACLQEEQVVYLIQTYVFPQESELTEEQEDVMIAMLETGIPAALFLRQCSGNPEVIKRTLESLLRDHPFADLPKHVHSQRMAAVQSRDANHYGHHLTMVWDDPHRQPPSITFTVPLE